MSGPYMLALYGSKARGDDDSSSDTDLLYIADDHDPAPVDDVDHQFCVSRYNWDEFRRMHETGSLFLLHLKMQSRPLSFDREGFAAYSQLLASLPEYANSRRDVAAFRISVADIRQALDSADTDVAFELGHLATTVRHASILGCYLLDIPEFGRYAAVKRFCEKAGLPIGIAVEFAELYQFRMTIERQQVRSGDPTSDYVEKWLNWATDVIEEVAACCEKN